MRRNSVTWALLATTMFVSGGGAVSLAAPAHKARHTAAKAAASQPAPAVTQVAAAAPAAPVEHHRTALPRTVSAEEVGVTARHLVRGADISIGSEMISRAVPGTNPLKVLASQPGIMFQSDDPQGVDTWSTQIYMHGFMQNQIGTTLDDIPLGELVYRNYNGLNPVQAISSENVQRLNVSMGAGAEEVASTNNLGGSIEYVSSDPKNKMGATLAQTFGSNSLFHTFIRLDSGKLNSSGTKFFVSYMRNDTDKWKGGGIQFMQQVNAKVVQPVGENSRISAFFDYSNLAQFNYQDYSLDIWKNGGKNIDNYYNGKYSGYQASYAAALCTAFATPQPGCAYPASLSKITDKADAAYYDGATAVTDYFGGLTGDFELTDRMRWKTTVYGHGETSHLTWSNPFYPSPNGAPMFEQVKEPGIQRFGLLSSVTYDIAHNHISGGVWYENNKFVSSMVGYQQPLLGQGDPIYTIGSYANLTPFMKIFGQTINTNTFTAFVEDTYHPVSNLDLHFGFKSLLNTSRAGDGYYNNAYYGTDDSMAAGTLTSAAAFLPHISADWHFLRHHELFFDVSENMHAYPQAQFKTAASPFAVTQAAYNLATPSLKPETDWAYSVGYRFTHRLLSASIYAYHVDYKNRLQQIQSGSIVNPVASVLNVGGVTMNGVDAGLTLTPVEGLSLFNSVSYNHSTYDDNITQGTTVYHLAGSQVVAYPRFMYKSSLSYEWGAFLAHIDASYMSKRNLSYNGDTKVPSYWLANAGLRYRLGNMGKYNHHLAFMQNLTFDFNVYNLANTTYVATMGENGFNLAGDAQSFELGAPRQFFGSVRVEF
ncbi:TonB-dependent receptor [Gluconacetobacter azotocaptans]|uniref:TonB-dependent receptor n=1 Tax=Gluconacetobacter azotocaptans TaxID=142834 RepID=A0A7W4JSH4_9PROT|nr:TonB-dependent receptor [Gluconacetobacter azotocaptans]MBB2190083.1 TonB-dependent receptor [Gluconacetobacter azotocaptans]MBM9402793.1 TonB-dependent receptor [Gluconacetobacter azotocaptans]